MKSLRVLVAVVALVWTGGALADEKKTVKLQTPDGKQQVTLTLEPCPLNVPTPTPMKLFLARIYAEGEQFDGCWTPSPDRSSVMIVSPQDKPTVRPDLEPMTSNLHEKRYET